MKVIELKEISEIDASVTLIHKQIEQLYRERAKLTQYEGMPHDEAVLSADAIPRLGNKGRDLWIERAHNRLEHAWRSYNVTIPKLDALRAQYEKAYDIMLELEATTPHFKDTMEAIIVPPMRDIPLPLRETTDEFDEALFDIDYVIGKIQKNRSRKNWTVILAYARSNGLYMGTPETIIDNDLFIVRDHDTSGLGILEYTCLFIACSEASFDTGTDTMLIKGMSPEYPIPYATRIGDTVKFRIDTFGFMGVFGNDRYRPAIRID